jgi:carboxyl-terminal processing protease
VKTSVKHYKEYGRAILIGAFAGLLLAIVFGAGFILRDFVEIPPVFAANSRANDSGYPLLDEVQSLLDNHYFREQPDYLERQRAAVRGVLGVLGDSQTYLIPPVVARSEADALAGTYGGIGVEVNRNIAGQFVLYPYPEGPAAREGIIDGDILLTVNGESIGPADQPDAIDQMLRGEVTEGSGVEIGVLQSDGTEFTVFISFDVINVPSVLWRVVQEDARIGYIQVLNFTSRTPVEMKDAIAELRQTDVEALILDLRDNRGGLLNEAVSTGSIFLDGGVVLYERTKDSERTFEAEIGGDATDMPLVLLVNRDTASAAELMAGAIQDRGRGLLIGQQTYGKGTIQHIFQLSDASAIHITSAEWFTPNRNALEGIGLQPDIELAPDETGREIELDEATRLLSESLNEN